LRTVPIRLRLKGARVAAGLTQQQLADAAQVSQAVISRIESGTIGSVTLRLLEKLANALDLDAATLVEHYDRPARKRAPKGRA
jgi:transcriptional regulator with XRE-family HTH domain